MSNGSKKNRRISSKLKKDIESSLAKADNIIRHIKNVQDNCLLLGKRLIERGDINLGKMLIANGLQHDYSKFTGIEFEFMSPKLFHEEDEAKLKLKLAIQQHRSVNPHHVEYWNNKIENMPDVFLAELCCDLKARSEEFGTSFIGYIEECVEGKWHITKENETYKKILEFVELLCEKPFQEIK